MAEDEVEEDIMEEDTMEDTGSEKTPKKKRISGGRLALIIVIVVVVLLILLFFFFFRGRARNMANMANTATSAVASVGDISVTIEGTGTLQSGTEVNVEVPAGITIDQVKVESGDVVKKGDVLATVKEGSVASVLLQIRDELDEVEDQLDDLSDDADDPDTDEYLEAKVLNAEYDDLKQAEYDLEDLLDSLKIKADCDGTITAVAVSDDTEVVAGQTNTGTSSGSSDSYTGGYTVMSSSAESTGTLLFLAATEPVEEDSNGVEAYADQDTDDGEDTDGDTSVGITSTLVIPVTAPKAGEKPQSTLDTIKDGDGSELIKKSSVSWDCSTEKFQAGTAYTATIILEASDGYVFDGNVIPVVEGAAVRYYRTYEDGKILYVQATFAATESESGKDEDTNDGSGNGKDTTGTEGGQTGSGSPAGSGTTGSGTTGGITGGTTGGTAGGTVSGSTGTSGDADSQLASYNAYEAAAFSVATGNDMTVSINVDELDILSVKEGQSAQVTLDALEGETYTGRITKVSTTAASTSGSAKYAVEITLDKTDDMMVGMSASATIYTDEAENVVLIPVSALQESGKTTFVYTQSDDDGNLSGETEVETGLSDGQNVQILSGLSEGDTVYYLRSGSGESSLFDMIGGMGGGAMGGGGAVSGERGDRGGGMGPFGN